MKINDKFTRRNFLKALGASSALMAFSNAFSEDAPLKAQGQSTLDVKPYKEVPFQKEDRNKVILAFSFSCPHCRSYDGILNAWGESLPKGYLELEKLPAVVDQESMAGAVAFYAYQKAVKGNAQMVNEFINRAFYLIQDEKRSPLDPETWRKAGAVVVDPKSVKNLVIRSAEKIDSYNIDKTPSLIIGGKYIINPNDAAGREDLFIQLANGISSMVLHELGYKG